MGNVHRGSGLAQAACLSRRKQFGSPPANEGGRRAMPDSVTFGDPAGDVARTQRPAGACRWADDSVPLRGPSERLRRRYPAVGLYKAVRRRVAEGDRIVSLGTLRRPKVWRRRRSASPKVTEPGHLVCHQCSNTTRPREHANLFLCHSPYLLFTFTLCSRRGLDILIWLISICGRECMICLMGTLGGLGMRS